MLRAVVIETPEQFDAHKEAWRALHAASGASLYHSFEWMAEWIRVFVSPGDLRIRLYYDGDVLAGAAPLFASTERHAKLTFRMLRLVGEPSSAYNGPLTRPECHAAVMQAWLGELKGLRPRWEVMVLRDLPCDGEAHLAENVANFQRAGFRAQGELSAHCYFIRASGSYDEFFRTTSSIIHENVPRMERRLARLGTLRVLRMSRGDIGIDEALREIEEDSAKSDKAALGLTLYKSPQHREFYTNFFRALPRENFDASFLQIGGKTIAHLAYLRVPGRRIMQSIGYKAEFAKYSPGKILFHLDLKHWFETEPGTTLDFARGEFDWKRHWNAEMRRNMNITVYAPGLKPALLYWNRERHRRAEGRN